MEILTHEKVHKILALCSLNRTFADDFEQELTPTIMKRTMKMVLVAMLSTVCCTNVAAQGVNVGDSKNMIRIDGIIPVTNINMTQGPKLLSDNSVEFTVRAPEAQKVQVDIGGTKYDMTKGDGGMWTVKTKPQVPGFHYYSLIIDGVSVADPASQSFYGCSRWSSAIEIPENSMDDFEVQNARRTDYFVNVHQDLLYISNILLNLFN